MKQLLIIITLLFSASLIHAQDVLILKTGEIIGAKISEVGIPEVKYYKSSNLNGPVYLAAKKAISMIVYQNGEKEYFPSDTTLSGNMRQPDAASVTQPVFQTVIIENPAPRRNDFTSGWLIPLIATHIVFSHHGGYASYRRWHH
jgi:hypothetical protein